MYTLDVTSAFFDPPWRRGMKLNLIFLLIDLAVLLAYPVVFVIYQVRKMLQARR